MRKEVRGKFSENKVRQCMLALTVSFAVFPMKAIDSRSGLELLYSPAIKDWWEGTYDFQRFNLMAGLKESVWFHNFRMFFQIWLFIINILGLSSWSWAKKFSRPKKGLLPFQQALQVLGERKYPRENNTKWGRCVESLIFCSKELAIYLLWKNSLESNYLSLLSWIKVTCPFQLVF